MKKIISLAIVCVMMLGMLSMVSFADAKAIEIAPYDKGIENWSGETHLLVLVDDEGLLENKGNAYKWEFTISDGTTTKTVTKMPTSTYDFGTAVLYRFQLCVGTAANQFAPEVGKEYTVTVKIYNGTELLYTGAAAEGTTFSGFGDDFTTNGAITRAPLEDGIINIGPKFGAWENWAGSPNKGDKDAITQLLVGITGEFGDPMLDDDSYVWEVTISDGTTSKTITTKPATHASAYNLYRFETCIGTAANQFVPAANTDYTVQITVYDATGKVVAKSAATTGFKTPEQFVPVEHEPLADPETPDTPVQPPKNGDATVFAVVFAAVAVLGMAVVVTKKVHA